MAERKTYATKTRSEMMQYIKINKDKMVSASDIIKHMSDIGSPVNQTTVYRFLDKLCESNKVVKYPHNSGEKSVYQYIDEKDDLEHGLHLKCKKCGKLIEMDCSFIDEFSKHVKDDHNFHIQYKGNVLYGICDDCDKKINNKK